MPTSSLGLYVGVKTIYWTKTTCECYFTHNDILETRALLFRDLSSITVSHTNTPEIQALVVYAHGFQHLLGILSMVHETPGMHDARVENELQKTGIH